MFSLSITESTYKRKVEFEVSEGRGLIQSLNFIL